MSLLFHGPRGSVEQRFIVYALLRDNVQHHLEGGNRSGRFAVLYSVAQALGGKPVRLDARKLHEEMVQARELLCSRPIAQLAIGTRTRAVIELAFPFPDGDRTLLVAGSGVALPSTLGAVSLGDVFGHLVDDLLGVSAGAEEGAQVEVTDL